MASYVCDDTDFNKFYFPEPLILLKKVSQKACKEAGKEAGFITEITEKVQKGDFSN